MKVEGLYVNPKIVSLRRLMSKQFKIDEGNHLMAYSEDEIYQIVEEICLHYKYLNANNI